ncbi:MAG TPA: hypothetical protein VH560_09725 [Polyangia bacterium]|nr:hypothetical protein [Polyangia bacterium]
MLTVSVVVVAGCGSGHGALSPGAGGSGASATAGQGGSAPSTGNGGRSSDGAAGATNAAAGASGSDAGVGASDASTEIGAATRLVPWQVEADGTDPLIMGIFDQQEKVHCQFLPDETGQLRCLPIALATFTQTAWFSDAACTKRIYTTALSGVGGSWTDRPTALPLPRVACAPNRYVVGTLKSLTAGAPHFGGTSCAAITPAPSPGYGLGEMTVVDVQTPDRWVTGTAVDGPRIGQRARVKMVEAPDGSRFTTDLFDEQWSRSCGLVANIDQVFCQVPTPMPVGVEGSQCAGKPVWLVHACEDPPFLGGGVAVGPQWNGPVTHSGHGCIGVPLGSTADGPNGFFEAGLLIGNGDVNMPSQPWLAKGTGRLRLRGLADDDGQVVTLPATVLWSELDTAVIQGAHARYIDSVANTTCNPIRTPEGLLRCVPTSIGLTFDSGFFADAGCTTPAFYCPNYADTCAGALIMSASLDPNGEVRATALSSARMLPTVFGGAPAGPCAPAPFTSPGMFAMGADATWTQFPTFSEQNGRAPDGL